ncbi:toll-like receptor 4 [Mercenaria mercenaria]|uniref:toll-like receptor 4 n=1 Tax=Mercenaria mercenaria TaxID=6596 RepID=UPI00234F00FD|nr:toll-like receptor 4 [Mercenaria mercenaria]
MLLLQIYFLFLTVSVFMTDSHEGTKISGMDDCYTEELSVICEHSLPYVLPDNMSRVIVKDFLHAMIKNETFTDITWMSVDLLDITVNHHVNLRLEDYNFYPLTTLKTLGIHSPVLTFKERNQSNILYGLTKLRTLNLSSCNYLSARELLTMLETHNRLDALILDQFATSSVTIHNLVIDNALIKLISKLEVRKLSLSGCNLLFKGPFQIENLSYYLRDFDISNTTLVVSSGYSELKVLLEGMLYHVKSLDASLIQPRFLNLDYSFLSNKTVNLKCNETTDSLVQRLFYKVENLKLNGILSRSMEITNSFFNLSACNYNLESLQLRSNKLHIFNSTLLWPSKIHLHELDLSLNDLEYLSPFAFGSILSLKRFHLAHNKLYLMASFVEFRYLFFTFKRLLHLDLSHNQLSWLPSTIFSNNINLTEIDLSHNKLASISFEIRHLINLRFLNMENNKIHYIDGSDLRNLVLLTENMPKPVEISFSHNPLLCNCQSEPFISWLSSYFETNKIRKYTCTLDGNDIVVDDKAVDETRFLCIRSRVVAVSVSTGIAFFCIISLAITSIVYRKRKQETMRKGANFLEDFKNGLLEQKFLCFLSFCSEDERHEIELTYENLRESLKALTGIEQELVCFGDKHINPGFPIVDEILRCVSKSCVAVFVVSNSFCESYWCQMEVREAYELNKPIILICKEVIDLTIMSPLMLKIFRQFTRAKIVTNENGQMELVPDFGHFSSSILKLAALRYEEGIN